MNRERIDGKHTTSDIPIIHMQKIKKRFGSFYALKGVDLDIYPGEIHALMGENGAGKSTLMKILAGTYTATEGTIYIDGKATHIDKPQDAIDARITLIYQEINLSPHLSVAENIYMGQELRKAIQIDRKTMIAETNEILKTLNTGFNASQKASELTVAEQQQVEIARALHRQSRILVMDEPTAALSSHETQILFGLIKQLKKQGVAIVYISHRMAEIYELADRVSVLRDGETVGQLMRSELNADKLVSMMVGRELSDLFKKRDHVDIGDVILSVKGASDLKGRVKKASLNVRKGEIVGLSGLVGAGRTELARLIFGVDKLQEGEVIFQGEPAHIPNPQVAMSKSIGYLPENRKEQGLFLQLSVKDNIVLNNLMEDSVYGTGIISKRRGKKRAQDVINKMRIRLASMMIDVESLSGGNQQKTLFARWVSIGPKLLILDEPTRGVDVGAKADIYETINQLSEQGCSILMISSELPEIVGMCDRVFVMKEGEITGELGNRTAISITQENIMQLATGASAMSNF